MEGALSYILFQLTLPDRHHAPAHVFELLFILFVSLTVTFNFLSPKLGICLRPSYMIVPMPEAPVNDIVSHSFCYLWNILSMCHSKNAVSGLYMAGMVSSWLLMG